MRIKGCLYLLNSETSCYQCSLPTPVFILAAENVHVEEEGWLDKNVEDPLLILLTYIDDMPSLLVDELSKDELVSLVYHKSNHDDLFRNHCYHCGCGQGDFYLMEPGGAFAPETEDRAALIGCKPILLDSDIEVEASYSIGGLSLADISNKNRHTPEWPTLRTTKK